MYVYSRMDIAAFVVVAVGQLVNIVINHVPQTLALPHVGSTVTLYGLYLVISNGF